MRVMTFLQAVCIMNSLSEVMMASCSTDTSPHQGHGLVSSSSVWTSSMWWQFLRVWIAKAWKRLKQETNRWRNFTVFLYTVPPSTPHPALCVHFGASAQPSPTVHPTQVFIIFKFFQDECLPCYVANGTQRLTFLEPLTTDQSSRGWLQSSHVNLLYPNWCVCPEQSRGQSCTHPVFMLILRDKIHGLFKDSTPPHPPFLFYSRT